MSQVQIPEHSDQTRKILLAAGKVPAEWLTSKQLATYLGVSSSHIRARTIRGKMAGILRIESRVFYNKKECLTTVSSNTTRKVAQQEIMTSLGSDESVLPEQLRSDSPEAVELMSVESTKPISKLLLPKARTQASYLRATAATVSLEDWGEVVKTALEHAKEGDAKARTWLSGYLIGTPIQRIAAIVEDNTEKFAEDERMKLLFAMMFGGEPDGESGAEAEAEGVVEVSYTDSSEVS